jgi:protein-ribulosamine 3-kinase
VNLVFLQQQLNAQPGPAMGELRATALSGGGINQAFCIEDGKHRFFVKSNRAELLPMFEAEQKGLDEIRLSGSIRVPQVIAICADGTNAYIILEFLELNTRPDVDQLAVGIASMHRYIQGKFGFYLDNTIGSTTQLNPICENWVAFWQSSRLGFQLQLAAQNGLDSSLLDRGARLNQLMGVLFKNYSPLPSLLHGDLWGGNQGADSEGVPVLFDPACYYGDHQADLAMMELFANPGDRFFSVYREHFPIDEDYPVRRDLYNLYHVLNHANLFGGGYAGQAQTMIDKLLAELD